MPITCSELTMDQRAAIEPDNTVLIAMFVIKVRLPAYRIALPACFRFLTACVLGSYGGQFF